LKRSFSVDPSSLCGVAVVVVAVFVSCCVSAGRFLSPLSGVAVVAVRVRPASPPAVPCSRPPGLPDPASVVSSAVPLGIALLRSSCCGCCRRFCCCALSRLVVSSASPLGVASPAPC
jgi:hypothetical protein